MSTAVKGLVAYSHVNICVTDVEAADVFYIGKLGLEKLPAAPRIKAVAVPV